MTKKSKSNSATKRSTLNLFSREKALPYLLGIMTQKNYTEPWGTLDFFDALDGLIEQESLIKEGNLIQAERLLIIQAQTLDTIFNNLACRASQTDFVDQIDALLRLALKAQSQCRTTLEALARIKNPPQVAFVRQTNIGHNQQINKCVGSEPQDNSLLEINKKQQNQLLEVNSNERLDYRAQSSTIRTHPKLEAVGKIHGPKN